jgi:membrane protein DedA with SNARE-associated domain
MHSVETITALVLAYRYLIIVPLSLVAQPLVSMITGALARLGYFDILILYGIVVATALLGDVGWYWIGYHWGESFARKFGRYFSITPKHVHGVKKIFSRYHTSILIVSKITNGVGLAWVTLFTAGMTRIPFGRYMALNLIGELVWSAMMLSVGYFFSHLYLTVHDVLGKAFIVAGAALLVALALGFWVYVRRRIAAEFEREG